MRPAWISEIIWNSTTVAQIRRRTGPWTLNLNEPEGLSWDAANVRLVIGSMASSPASSVLQSVTFTTANSTFGNFVSQETGAGARIFSKKALSTYATGKVRLRTRSRFGFLYEPDQSGNQVSGVGFQNFSGTNAVAIVGNLVATQTKTQVMIRAGANGATPGNTSALTVTDRTKFSLWQGDLNPGVSFTVSQNGTLVGSSSTANTPVLSDYANLRPRLGHFGTTSAVGTDQTSYPVCVYNLQASASTVTVA